MYQVYFSDVCIICTGTDSAVAWVGIFVKYVLLEMSLGLSYKLNILTFSYINLSHATCGLSFEACS